MASRGSMSICAPAVVRWPPPSNFSIIVCTFIAQDLALKTVRLFVASGNKTAYAFGPRSSSATWELIIWAFIPALAYGYCYAIFKNSPVAIQFTLVLKVSGSSEKPFDGCRICSDFLGHAAASYPDSRFDQICWYLIFRQRNFRLYFYYTFCLLNAEVFPLQVRPWS